MRKRSERTDSVRNRATLLKVAEDIFAQHGFGAPLELIALKAGVSRATLYRNFPDREALGFAIFEEKVSDLEHHARIVRDKPDGFIEVLERLTSAMVESAGWADAVSKGDGGMEKLAELRTRTSDLMAPLFCQAQSSGMIRPDIKLSDLAIVVDMLAGSIGSGSVDSRRFRADRAMNIVFFGVQSVMQDSKNDS